MYQARPTEDLGIDSINFFYHLFTSFFEESARPEVGLTRLPPCVAAAASRDHF